VARLGGKVTAEPKWFALRPVDHELDEHLVVGKASKTPPIIIKSAPRTTPAVGISLKTTYPMIAAKTSQV
jgi:hypothetical protein